MLTLISAMKRTTSSEKAPPIVDTPMSAVGRSARTAEGRSGTKAASCAKGSLWCCSDARRDAQTWLCVFLSARGSGNEVCWEEGGEGC